MIATPSPTRTETMIALRARREAFAIVQEVERSRIPASDPLPAAEIVELPQAYAEEFAPIYEPRILPMEEVQEPAPPWIMGLLACCLTAIAIATIVIFKITR